MSSANLRAFLLRAVLAGAPILALAACGTTDGPIFDPDAGEDAGPEPDAGRDAGDQEAPTVVSTTPAAGATGVSPGADVVIEFSEAMADAGTIALTADGAALTPTRAWSADARTLTLSADLPSDARVRLIVERDFADLAGNRLAAPHVVEFTTADAVPPVVTGADPIEGAVDVSARTAQIRVSFSEPMDPSVGTLALEGGPGTLGEIAWTLGGMIVPVSGLAYGTSYRVVLSGFADPSGNALDGASYLGDGALDFTTGPDTDPPRVTDASPSEGQIEVRDTTAAVTVTFDEAMDTSVTEATLSAAGESVTVTGAWSAGGTRVDFDVEGLLARNTAHSLDLTGFRDAAGNALDPAPHLGDGALDFVTGVDIFAPYVGFTDPVEGATDVSFRRGTITVVFSEAMDTSTTSVEVSDGTSSFTATGTWSLAGTRFEIDVADRLYATRSYTIDFSAFADAGGTALDAAHPYLGDGVLDFTLGAPTGENCRDALTVAEGTLADGVHEWVLAPGAVTINDGSNTCPGGNTPGIDAVIRYTKTTAAASAGGTALRIYVESAETITNAWMSVAVLHEECDPTVAGLGPARIRCVDDDNPQHLYLDVGPGDYYVWVSRYTGSDFRGGTVRIEEVTAPPEGESCLAPFTTSTADTIYTAPASADDPHRWTIPYDAVQAMDHAVAYNGPGAMACDERIGGGPDTNVGNDAVIELPKASGTSIGWLHVESVHTSYELVAQLLDRCDTTDPAATSLACQDGLRIVSSTPRTLETTFDGAAGSRYLWLANDASYNDFPGAIVTYREIEPAPGDTCATAIPLTVGATTTLTVDRPHRLPAPSCFGSAASVTWYRFTVPERALLVTGTTTDATPGAVALVDAAAGSELSCAANIATATQNAFLTPGTEVCLAVESGRVAQITVDAVPYDGLDGQLTDILIDRPLNATGSERGLASSQWMQVTPTTVYLGVGTGSTASSTSNFLAYAPRSGGVRAEANDAYQGPVNGYAAVAIGEAVFAVDDASTGTAARLHRILDASGGYGAVAWDTGTSYPSYSIRSIAYDGTDLWLVSHATTTTHQTRVWRVSATTPGPLTLVGDIPDTQRVLGIALDSTYMYLAATSSGSAGVFRLALADIGPSTPTPERIATLALPTTSTDVVLDDAAAPLNLYVRGSAGVHVVTRPASATPRDLGLLVAVTGSGRPMARDPVTGALYLIQTSSTDQIFVRMD